MPWCFVRAADLPREFDDEIEMPTLPVPPGALDHLALLMVTTKDRACAEWWPNRDPLTPADHLRDRGMMRLEEARASREERLAEMERQAAADSAKIQADSIEIARTNQATMDGLRGIAAKTDQFQSRWTKVAVGLALLTLAIVIVGYFLPHLGADIAGYFLGASPVPLP
jgi:hypothetical protein